MTSLSSAPCILPFVMSNSAAATTTSSSSTNTATQQPAAQSSALLGDPQTLDRIYAMADDDDTAQGAKPTRMQLLQHQQPLLVEMLARVWRGRSAMLIFESLCITSATRARDHMATWLGKGNGQILQRGVVLFGWYFESKSPWAHSSATRVRRLLHHVAVHTLPCISGIFCRTISSILAVNQN